MKALILAAGLGTRLRPLTENAAKPGLPVLGVPVLWFGAAHLSQQLRIDQFAINIGHGADSLRQAVSDPDLRRLTKAEFHFSDETSQILGSSGALWKLKSWIGKDTLAVWNGDNICSPSWKKMLEFHRSRKALLTMHVRAFKNSAAPYTDIAFDSAGRVTAFNAKANSGIMFSSCYFLEPELLRRLPEGVSELRPTLLEPLIREGKLYAFREDIDWLDIGNVALYAEAQMTLLERLPEARRLVELKMREESPGCWVPKSWPNLNCSVTLNAPVVIMGDCRKWMACAQSFGPRFVGVEPPAAPKKISSRDTLVYLEHSESLKQR